MTNKTPFRFYDNRQKYLLFVNTCSEKWETSERIGAEFDQVRPCPPALRLFDAGMGDGTVLVRVMRTMHRRFPNIPFYVCGKEISLEDVRLCLEKLPDRLYEHPMTVFVATNLYYYQAPWLSLKGKGDDMAINWVVLELDGEHSHEFEEQITNMQRQIASYWQAAASSKTGNPVYLTPTVLVIYRKDQKFVLDDVIPHRGDCKADFDMVVASQPYRARVTPDVKVRNVVAPLTKALGVGGRLIGVHSHGHDPGLEIVREVWPDEDPFQTNRHMLWSELENSYPDIAHDCALEEAPHNEAIFKYGMHTLPSEISAQPGGIGTSTLLAAWNAAVYVAQIDDERLEEAIADGNYIEATRRKLAEHGGLWFQNELYTIVRHSGTC